MVSYGVGVSLALTVGLFATLVGFDRDRAFYPTVTIVVASYYALFALIGASLTALAIESLVMLFFVLAAVLGFKRNLWIVVGALVGHGVFDSLHAHMIANPGMPLWWPGFCLAYDVVAGGYLALMLTGTRATALRSKP
jgi:hypothetical protein